MEGGGSEKWSHEALQAMDTHLRLLRKGKRAWISKEEEENKEADYEEQEVEMRPKRRQHYGDKADKGLDLNRLLTCSSTRTPLPHGWEQFLHIRTGQVYYVDWKRCRRSYMDPRPIPSLDRDDDYGEPEVSECISDSDNHGTVLRARDACMSDKSKPSMSRLITSPMLQEDWDLMESRGWMSGDGDDQSEISFEATSPQYVSD